MNYKTYYITGTSGFSEEVAFALKRTSNNEVNVIFIESNRHLINTMSSSGIKILSEEILKDVEHPNVLITVSHPVIRKNIVEKYTRFNAGIVYPNFLDSSLIIDIKTLTIGVGNIILHNTIITSNVILGNYNILNSYSGIGHDSKIGSFNTFNPRVAISGNVCIGDSNNFGMNSGILPNKNILDNNNIWINTIVTKNYKSDNTLFGVPSKKILK